jgi:SIR2-like domain
MRFLPAGPDIPPELVAAQEEGQTIFVCGAGVSRGVGLPLFRGLVEGVYQHLGEDWTVHPAEREGMRQGGRLEGQYDRVLRCLERRLAASDAPRNRGMRERIRAAVRHVLAAPDNADLANHLALLELSRDAEGRNRILTTNFDTLFERAWFEKHHVAIATHAGVAMPPPKVAACTGVLHLHGRLADPRPELRAFETDLVLTSAEFGDAYLRSGWASRYIYDLVRAYTVVLVGYQADDPPMRYLLEALEADRERYPDLQRVYAFASCEPGNEEFVQALWVAKAVEPIVYLTNGEDHSALYNSLREWRRYAEDPTAWRREQLRGIVAEAPDSLAEDRLQECVALFRHGDANQLLGELSPRAEWLSVLLEKRVFDRDKGLPGEWIGKLINDPGMIKACAGLVAFDDHCRWHINRALERKREALTAVRARAWRLLLLAKRPKSAGILDDSWYLAADNIKRGEADFEARQLVRRILRPRLDVKKTLRWGDEAKDPNASETLHDLLRVEFDPAEDPPASEILAAWPQAAAQEIALFRTLDRAMLDALEEAEDVGLFEGWDRTSYDVPSVAAHRQNAHHSGFYPITRALADLWHRIAARDVNRARTFAQPWSDSPFLLVRRLALFAFEHAAFSPQEAAAAILKLDQETFWTSGAQVEIMRILLGRWAQFSDTDRLAIEARLRRGVPRDLYRADAFEDEDEWNSIWDSSIYRRLKRIEQTGGALTEESQALLAEISARHPKWQPSAGDRDDFHVWHESRSGPDGQPELLADIADDRLVKEAMRLQRERHFEQGDVWRVFCSADPERALRGLRHEADNVQWDSEAWRCLLWAANEKGDAAFQFALADLLLRMPEAPLRELVPSVSSWLQKRREVLSGLEQPGGARFLPLWDRLADLTYGAQDDAADAEDGGDLLTDSLNRPGGVLAWTLLDALSAPKPKRDSHLGADLKPRFDRLAVAAGRPGLLARVYLVHALAYLDAIDPAWTEEHFWPRLSWDHPEGLAL